ncbi:Lrp/AsnC family transcriptional regulator [Leptolyngbya sp. FACHB-261]|uniref:Lrp/AsnC family transcriptional regulator n=1 Tax=Leptolyngbya sp. FACHB-261 TaxID=2692806 RepID=UPI0016893CCC|nr:Lrp/AsnC family transcriptional regulator [Leptolyngbya sp. FACHB-261]MBD2104717.1 Lrp/AsnC family transcriptional regulator [Leptolyngbya sp. FACHB-261]
MLLETIDLKAIRQLMTQGRTTWAELAGVLGLSAPAAADRVRRLEERGVIRGYAALIQPEAVGYDLTAFVAVTLERPEHRAAFLQLIQNLPEVQECHHIAGDDDYLLKVRCLNTRDLERLVSDQLKGLSGIVRTRTTIVLSTLKETPALPLPSPNSPSGDRNEL